jgi:hypothetical protein
MIREDQVWYNVTPKDYASTDAEIGKWLYFGEKNVLHSWLPRLNELVEAGELRAAKISRKDPRWDPFPHKPCVLCAFTANDEQEKTRVKRLLAIEFGIDVSTWKSDAQTLRDWDEYGWLQIESQITNLKRRMAAGDVPDTPETKNQLRALISKLSDVLHNYESDTLLAEQKLSKTEGFLTDLQRELASENLTLATILNHLDRIQVQISRITQGDAIQVKPDSIDQSVRNEYLFVIMPFGKQHVDTYDTIRRAILKVSPILIVERVDEKPGSFQITQEIWNSIKSARAIICDLTDERPNVYYELGYAHALLKPVVCVARDGTSIHFDVSGFKVVLFNTYRELEERLRDEIDGVLKRTQR